MNESSRPRRKHVPWRKTSTASLFVRHQQRCPKAWQRDARCRCVPGPSYRAVRRNPVTKKPEWSPTSANRSEILVWLGQSAKGASAVAARHEAGPTVRELANRWRAGVEEGAIGSRRGRPYSPTTIAGYFRSLEPPKPKHKRAELPRGWGTGEYLLDEFGAYPAAELSELELQMWIDRLAREGLSRSRIANHVAVLSAIYAWASRPTRRLVRNNPTRGLELPPNDAEPRLRVASAADAAALLAALEPDDRVPYALGFYAGLRRAEIARLDWPDVDLDGYRLLVRKAKSEAGSFRRPPIADPLRPILLAAHHRQGEPTRGPVSSVSVMSGKLAERATNAWTDASKQRATKKLEPLERITLHECRHTYASFLMAARYTLRELMEYMGHASLQATQRYVKLLPQPDEKNPADRLNAFLRKGVAG